MAAPAVLRLRDPGSYASRGLRNLNGAALRGGPAPNPGGLVCQIVTVIPAGADITLTAADAIVTLTPADATVTVSACN